MRFTATIAAMILTFTATLAKAQGDDYDYKLTVHDNTPPATLRSQDGRIGFNFHNSGTQPMCIFPRIWTGEGINNVGINVTPVKLQPGQTVRLDGLSDRFQDYHGGVMNPRFGCDHACGNCEGIEKMITGKVTNDPGGSRDQQALNPVAHMLFEWNRKPGGEMFVDISHLHGISAKFNVQLNGPECPQFQCGVTKSMLENLCPPERRWSDGETMGCMSDCTATNTEEHCCHRFQPGGVCNPSSPFLHDICEQGYAWAKDDKHTRACSGVTDVDISLGSID
ncbi:hypothetical protein B0J14DRAFT_681841 [Halenospora varia]|nr:hypothetical protein B0J14DRAFT_681841 [Halenospora varia]